MQSRRHESTLYPSSMDPCDGETIPCDVLTRVALRLLIAQSVVYPVVASMPLGNLTQCSTNSGSRSERSSIRDSGSNPSFADPDDDFSTS